MKILCRIGENSLGTLSFMDHTLRIVALEIAFRKKDSSIWIQTIKLAHLDYLVNIFIQFCKTFCTSYNILNSPVKVNRFWKQFRNAITKILSTLLSSEVQSDLWQISFVNPRAGKLIDCTWWQDISSEEELWHRVPSWFS